MANPIVQQINNELSELQRELSKFKNTVDYLNGAKAAVKDAVIKVNHSEAHFNKKVEELKSTYNSIIGLSDSVSSVMKKLDTINFPERLDNIEQTVEKTITSLEESKQATLEEIQNATETIKTVDFDNKFLNLKDLIQETVLSNDKLIASIEDQELGQKILDFEKNVNAKIKESYKEIEQNTNKIAKDSAKSITDLNLPTKIDKLDANIAGISVSTQNLQGRLDLLEGNLNDKFKDSNEKLNSEFINLGKSIVQEIKQSSAQIESNNNITKTRVDNLTILLNDFINQQNKVHKNQEIKLNNIQITVIIFFVILFFTALIF